jgi:branched-chain amino acid transport system substrate-binding protein
VLNTLIGPSSYAFIAAYRDLADEDGEFEPLRRPVISCNLSENELADMVTIAAGHYSVAPYFRSLPTAANAAFLAEARDAAPDLAGVSAFFAHAYCAVRVIAAGIEATSSDDATTVLGHAKAKAFAAPYGPLRIDSATNHAILTPLIGRATAFGDFEIVERLAQPVIPDPYLARLAAIGTPTRSPHLRVVK